MNTEGRGGARVPCIALLGAVGIEEEAHDCEEGCRYWITVAGQRVGSPGNFTDINTVRDWLEIAAPNAERLRSPASGDKQDALVGPDLKGETR